MMMSLSDFSNEFRAQLALKGWKPEKIIADGRFHRFDTGQACDRAGWYVLHCDGAVSFGAFGCWRSGEKFSWSAKNGTATREEKEYIQRRLQDIEEERVALAQKAAQRAAAMWDKAAPANPGHPYLVKKGVKPNGLRQRKGLLLVPIMCGDSITSLQMIASDGTKRFLRDGTISGGYYTIPGKGGSVLCEGFATGASIHSATGYTVYMAFSAGNLGLAAEAIDRAGLIIAADNDAFTVRPDGSAFNPGRTKAFEVAWRYTLPVAVPTFAGTNNNPTDFNDLNVFEGAATVRRQIQAAKKPAEALVEESILDVGAPFRTEHLNGLKQLRARDKAAFMCLRQKLKTAHVGVTALDEALSNFGGDTVVASGKKRHLEIAESIIHKFGSENILYTHSFFWLWNESGVWSRIDDRVIKAEIQNITRELPGVDATRFTVDSVLDMTKTSCFRQGHEFDICAETINCLKGELIFNGEDWELKPHDKEHYATAQIPIDYDSSATAPRFEAFLNEVFEPDQDRQEKRIIVCELLGYSLLRSARYEKFILLVGPGGNGKSVLMDVVTALVGIKNTAAVQPGQFDNRFQRAHLQGKLVNVVSEIAEGHEIKDDALKAITSGELCTVEHKHKAPFDITPFATCWFGTNHLPHTRDFSEGMFRRAIILTFNRVFAGAGQDTKLKEKLRGELPGILNLALAGLTGLYLRGEFTTVKSCEEIKKEWRLNCDQVRQFVADECEIVVGSQTTSFEIYTRYQQWASDAGIKKTLNRRNFTERLHNLGVEQARGNGGTRLLAGIGLK